MKHQMSLFVIVTAMAVCAPAGAATIFSEDFQGAAVGSDISALGWTVLDEENHYGVYCRTGHFTVQDSSPIDSLQYGMADRGWVWSACTKDIAGGPYVLEIGQTITAKAIVDCSPRESTMGIQIIRTFDSQYARLDFQNGFAGSGPTYSKFLWGIPGYWYEAWFLSTNPTSYWLRMDVTRTSASASVVTFMYALPSAPDNWITLADEHGVGGTVPSQGGWSFDQISKAGLIHSQMPGAPRVDSFTIAPVPQPSALMAVCVGILSLLSAFGLRRRG